MLKTPVQAAAPGLPSADQDGHLAVLPFHRRPDPAASADDPRRPSALVIFPAPPVGRCRAMAALLRDTTGQPVEELGPTLNVTTELLGLDDLIFRARLRDLVSDPIGRALLAELRGSLQSASADLDRAGRAIFIVRARITAGLGNMGGAHVR